jgi:16S rRNA (adenine1518-N6/adenine1519-N6)-dimethyltransferase
VKPSEIRATLERLGSRPTQSLGQNFLHDRNLAEWIVAQLDLQPGEPWVELGPGLGALTEFAVARSANGLVIEKDGRLVPELRARFPGLEIVHGDAAEYDLRALFARGPVKVLGNLPYYISSQILLGFTAEPSPVSALVFTLQKELAERLAAEPRTKAYGALTLLLGRRWQVQYLRTIPPTVFAPQPGVESALVRITPRPPGDVPECDGELFRKLVKLGFSQRRKLLRKNLAAHQLDWPALTAHLGVLETTRAEELSLEQWIALTNFAAGNVAAPAAQDVHGEIFDVVDERDRPTGTATRHEVHERNLRHRAVHILVFNARGDVFLQKRSRWKDRHPGQWDSSAAGHVNAGHEYGPTAVRELEEEIGISAPVEEIARIAACAGTGWEFVRMYRARHDGPFRLAPSEIECGAFFTVEQVRRWTAERPQDFAPGFLECWSRAEEKSLPEVFPGGESARPTPL